MPFRNRINEIDALQERINSYRPLDRNTTEQIREYYRIGLTYSSNAIEGNTLTEVETKVIIEDGLTIGGKSVREHQEVIGHSDAYDFLYTLVNRDTITEKDIKKLHRTFYYRIDEKNAGKYRKVPVIITGTDFIPPGPEKIPGLMEELCAHIPDMKEKYHPVEYAARLHGDIVTIHPFVDGNGRTARLIMNLALLKQGYVITIIPPVIRSDYISALQAYNKGKVKEFINLISAMVYESQKDYLRILEALNGGK